MKKSGFTLAEILISLMILGVIASLTIPSLIQNTQKKEQIVQLKKGLSMINQAITMNYALTSEDLSSANNRSVGGLSTILKQRLSVVDSGDDWVRTQDGLTYYFNVNDGDSCGETDAEIVNDNEAGVGACFDVIISTKPVNSDLATSYDAAHALIPESAKVGTATGLTGYYQFFAGADRVVPSKDTQLLLNAQDATKFSTGS